MVDKVTQANKKIAAQSARTRSGPVGTKMMEMLDVPSFARGLTPQILIDLAKSKNIITKEQQTDFKNRVGKDRTALAEFNEIVTKADQPNLTYKGQSPAQIELLRAKNLMPATAMNKTKRISVLKDTHTLLNEAASMDAPKEVKEKTFLEGMRKKFGDFADNPIVRKIASRALMILGAFPTALDFIPMSLLEEGMDMMDKKDDNVYAGGGIVGINDITKPVGV
jgi:predicted DNA-binding protein (MmcQ/YjbR family)